MIRSHRYTIHVPTHDSEGDLVVSLAAHVEATLLRHFGGFTEVPAVGGWRPAFAAKGQLAPRQAIERVSLYFVDVFENHPSAYDTMHALALRVKAKARQECVYLTRETIEAEIVD